MSTSTTTPEYLALCERILACMSREKKMALMSGDARSQYRSGAFLFTFHSKLLLITSRTAIFTSNIFPNTPEASSTNRKLSPVIYGLFLCGPNGEMPTVNDLVYLEEFVKNYIRTPFKIENGADGHTVRYTPGNGEGHSIFCCARVDRAVNTEPVPGASVSQECGITYTGRRYVRTPSEIDNTKVWLEYLAKLIERLRTRTVWYGQMHQPNDGSVNRIICGIGMTWNPPKRRFAHENHEELEGFGVAQLVDAVAKTGLSQRQIRMRFRVLHRVKSDELAEPAAHIHAGLLSAYASEGGFNTESIIGPIEESAEIDAYNFDTSRRSVWGGGR